MDILVLDNSTNHLFNSFILFVLTKKDNADSYFLFSGYGYLLFTGTKPYVLIF